MRPLRQRLHLSVGLLVILWTGSGCSSSTRPFPVSSSVELRIGFGLANGQAAFINQIVQNVATEALVSFSRDGRYQPWLAQSVDVSADGLTWRITLRDVVRFHDGTSADAAAVTSILKTQFRRMGSSFDDVEDIVAEDATHIAIKLKSRSALFVEGFGVTPIERPESNRVGTGPFALAASNPDGAELRRYDGYYGGPSAIDRITIRPYETVRAAWADLLRDNTDMLYEVGGDALDSLEPSTRTRIYTFSRPYAYVGILNTHRPSLKAAAVRQALNAAIDREKFIAEALNGHGQPATGPVSPYHWANALNAARAHNAPRRLASPLAIHCLYVEPADERLALVVKRMLEDIGATVTLELVPQEEAYARMQRGDFDIVLNDQIQGPGLLRPLWFWGTGEQFNWGHYSNAAVDAAFKAIRIATNDDQYKAGVRALQQAMLDDPPAIFLAWRERARAVSTRFEVPAEPGRDILRTLRLWKPIGGAAPPS